jgi:hypothetical protein
VLARARELANSYFFLVKMLKFLFLVIREIPYMLTVRVRLLFSNDFLQLNTKHLRLLDSFNYKTLSG